MTKLTLKQKRFADEYIISGNATKAAILAGYSERYANTNASKLLQNTTLKAYIGAELEKLESEKTADKKEVLEFFTSIMRGEITEPIAVGVGEGVQEIVEVKPSVQTRKSAAVELAKRYGLNADDLDVEHKKLRNERLRKENNTESTIEDRISELFDKVDEQL